MDEVKGSKKLEVEACSVNGTKQVNEMEWIGRKLTTGRVEENK